MSYQWKNFTDGCGGELYDHTPAGKRFIGSYGDAPEDQSHYRDWAWVEPELNRLATALDAAEARAERYRRAIEDALAVSKDRQAFVMQGMRAWARAERILEAALAKPEGE